MRSPPNRDRIIVMRQEHPLQGIEYAPLPPRQRSGVGIASFCVAVAAVATLVAVFSAIKGRSASDMMAYKLLGLAFILPAGHGVGHGVDVPASAPSRLAHSGSRDQSASQPLRAADHCPLAAPRAIEVEENRSTEIQRGRECTKQLSTNSSSPNTPQLINKNTPKTQATRHIDHNPFTKNLLRTFKLISTYYYISQK